VSTVFLYVLFMHRLLCAAVYVNYDGYSYVVL